MHFNCKYDPSKNVFFHDTGEKEQFLLPNLMWHITGKCPLSCSFCFSNNNGNDFNKSEIKESVDVMKLLGCQKVDISGGEPLMSDVFQLVCKQLWRNNIFTTVTTSGYSNASNKDFVIRNVDRFARIIFSLDAPDQAFHDGIRGQGAYLNLEKLIIAISNIKSIKLRINTVLLPKTIATFKPVDFMKLLKYFNIDEWCIIYPFELNEDYSDSFKKDFDRFVEDAKRLSFSKLHILTREKNLYKKYWILEPDGVFHSRDNDRSYQFLRHNLKNIMKLIKQTGIVVPLA